MVSLNLVEAMQLALIALTWGKAAVLFGLAYCAWRIARRF